MLAGWLAGWPLRSSLRMLLLVSRSRLRLFHNTPRTAPLLTAPSVSLFPFHSSSPPVILSPKRNDGDAWD